jgi:hypothetical protein
MNSGDHDLDHDPVWDVVDQARPQDAGPLFSRNVMREIRLSEQETRSWWKGLFGPKPLAFGGLAAAAAFAILLSWNPGSTPSTPGLADDDPAPTEVQLAELDEELNQELLIAAAEDPSLFSDEQLLALLY